mmetsp:Transcript_4423/g.4957  ORF Transcript_4423/g.4957 Transcript_4423/m.4957 type:complete len:309 (+) Transcript_4423:57-983(+)
MADGLQITLYCFAGIGVVWVLVKILALMAACWKYFGRGVADVNQRYGCQGNSWAVITGGSDGIGKGFAEVLAQQGVNVCIVARNEEKMGNVAGQLKMLNPEIQTRCVVADFAKSYQEDFYPRLMGKIEDLDICLLVNNVGVVHVSREADLTEQQIRDLINVNIVSHAVLQKYVVERMRARSQRSAIINLSSYSGEHYAPMYSLYSGSKAFNNYLSIATSEEEREKVDIISFRPMWVQTPMTEGSNGAGVIDPITAAKCCLRDLPYNRWTIGHWKHALNTWMLEKYPTGAYLAASMNVGIKMAEDRKKK